MHHQKLSKLPPPTSLHPLAVPTTTAGKSPLFRQLIGNYSVVDVERLQIFTMASIVARRALQMSARRTFSTSTRRMASDSEILKTESKKNPEMFVRNNKEASNSSARGWCHQAGTIIIERDTQSAQLS